MSLKKESPEIPALEKRIRRHVTGRVREYFVVTAPGFETECRNEVLDLGIPADTVAMEPGGVRFNGRLADCLRANLHLRTATRILMRIAEFTATNTRQLEKKTAAIPWEVFLPENAVPAVSVRAHRSRLYHTGVIAGSISEGIAKTRFAPKPPPGRLKSLPQTLFVRVVEDRFVLSLDTSGAALYKRGLKLGTARAPIRETLAAAILMAAGYDPEKPLVDPLCGSGTFSIEAAMMAKHMAPGMNRRFAFMDWPGFSDRRWESFRQQAACQARPLPCPHIFASDVDKNACRQVRNRIAENALTDAVSIQTEDFFQLHKNQFGPDTGWIVINPPYGVRIGSPARSRRLLEDICAHLFTHFDGWNFALIVPDPEQVRHFPFPAHFRAFIHGGLKLTLATGHVVNQRYR